MSNDVTRRDLTTIARGYVDKFRGSHVDRQYVLNQLSGRLGPNEQADLLPTEYAAATALVSALLADNQDRVELMSELLKGAREL